MAGCTKSVTIDCNKSLNLGNWSSKSNEIYNAVEKAFVYFHCHVFTNIWITAKLGWFYGASFDNQARIFRKYQQTMQHIL